MSLYELGDSTGKVSLQELFEGECINRDILNLIQGKLVNLIVRGGWPENINVKQEDAGILPRQYIDALVETDFTSIDNRRRNPELVQQLLTALVRTNVTPAKLSTITVDVQARFGDITRQTIADYLASLMRLYVVEEIPQWFPELRDKQHLRKVSKRMLTDPYIAVSVLRARSDDLVRDPRSLGMLFENLCMRDLLVYSEIIYAKLSHYHDLNGLEVDVILEQGVKWAAIEIKLGEHRVDEGAKALKKLQSKLTTKGASTPSFLAVITGNDPCYTREDGIHVIPIDCLKP